MISSCYYVIWLVVLCISRFLTHAPGILPTWITRPIGSHTELHNQRREWRENELIWRCLWRGYWNLLITCPAWNLPYDRAWEKAPPYDRAWKKTCHILGICAHIPSIHWAYRSVYHIQAYMLLYTRFMIEYNSIWQDIPGLRWYRSVYADIY